MGAIEKRGKNTWRISAWTKTDSGPQQVRMTLHMDPAIPESVQRQDAQRELMKLELRLSAPARNMTLREWSEEWLTKHQQDNTAVTVFNYRQLLNSRILPMLGDVPLSDLTPAILTDWLLAVRNSPRMTTRLNDEQLAHPRSKKEKLASASKLKKPLSASTVDHYYTCMTAMLQVAVRMGYLDYNPMNRVQKPKKHKKKPVPIAEQKAVNLLRDIMAVDDSQRCYRTAVLLALFCSPRLGEVGGLQWRDVDFRGGTITISRSLKYTPETGSFIDAPKSDAAIRTIHLPPSVIAYLDQERYKDTCDQIEYETTERAGEYPTWQSDWIIHGPDGRQLHKDTPSKWFHRFVLEHGYSPMTFHDLRHAHASILVAHNIDIAAVAARMGHSNPNVTLSNYTHPMDTHEKAAAAALEALFAQIVPTAADPAADATTDDADNNSDAADV